MKKLFTVLPLVLATSAAMAYEQDKTYQFTILHTNDTHGHFWPNAKGEYGFPAHKTIVNRVKAEVEKKGGSLVLLNAGDFNTGVPESDMQTAEPDIKAMNAMGYEATVLGNHEFDNPLQILDMQEKWANFPFLSANVINTKTGKTLVKPYTILNKQDLKIAVVGLTTEDTAKLGNPEYLHNVKFEDPTTVAKATLKELNEKVKPDVKIALTHMGYYYDAKHGSNAPGDVSLARNLDKGAFDMIIGGHSHDPICVDDKGVWIKDYQPTQPCKPDFQNGTWIMQAFEWGKYVGRADFEFKNGELKLVNYQLIPVNLKKKVKKEDGKTEYVNYTEEIPQDPEMEKLLKSYQDKGDALLSQKVGKLNGKLEGDRTIIRFEQTNLGHLIAEAQRQKAKADIGIMNSGGIRDSIQEGDVTYKDILKIHPFGNIVSYFELTGKELLDYLNVVALKEVDSGAYAQYSGISMTVNRADKKVENVKIQGKPLDLNKIYRISVPSYNAAGGDGYPVMTKNPTFVNTGFIDADVLKEFFEKNSPINAEKYIPHNEVTFMRSKEVTQKALRDLEREQQLLQELVQFAESQNYQLEPQYITSVFQKIIEDSVLTQQVYLQKKLNEQREETLHIAFLGKRGSYSNLAARNYAARYHQQFAEISCDSFAQIFEKVEIGEADYGVLPLENTTSGAINEVYDLLQHTTLSLVGELAYPIKHCVLVNEQDDLSKIDTLYSHPQVIQQCSQFIQSLERVHIEYCESSSHAMQLVASLNKPNIAALGNEDGGKLYGLHVLKHNIANQENNITRFIVVAKQAREVSPQIHTKTLLLMTTSQQAGNIHHPDTQIALEELKQFSNYLKVLGCYPSEIVKPAKV